MSTTTTSAAGGFASLLSSAQASGRSTLTFPFYGYDQQPIVGSIVSADTTATTIQLACRQGTDGDDCGLFPMQTLTVGPSLYHMDMGAGDSFTGTQDCSTMGTTGAVCSESMGGSEANDPGSSSTSYGTDDIGVIPVTITAGNELLGVASSTGSSPSSADATATSTSGSVIVLTGSGSSSGSTGASASVTASGSSSGTDSSAAASSSSAASAGKVMTGGALGLLAAMVGLWFS